MSNWINTTRQLVLVHVPKCGGSSIRRFSKLKFEKERYLGHLPVKYQDYTIIGMCRHPIDRFLSAYKMFRYGTSDANVRWHKLTIDKAIDVLEDSNISPGPICTLPKDEPTNMSLSEHFKHHIIPITHPYNYMKDVDNIIRFENYADDVNRYFRDVEIPHRHKTADRSITLTEQQKARLYDIYHEDFVTYNYKLR